MHGKKAFSIENRRKKMEKTDLKRQPAGDLTVFSFIS
jgi:hypothetical protein